MTSEEDIAELRRDFWEKLDDSPFAMIGLESDGLHSVPMNVVLDKNADSNVWFYTSRDNRLANGGRAMMQFASKGHDLFACVAGTLVEEVDPEVIDRYWSNAVEAWYPQGRKDPKLLMLRFELHDAEIWEADPGVVGMFKMMTGITMQEGDMGEHERVTL